MRGSLIAVVLGCATLVWPRTADACSCGRIGSEDLRSALQEARENASAIYLATIVSTDGKSAAGKARAKVLEVFKGGVRTGQELTVPSGGGGDCTIPFNAGETYLMYASRGGPTQVFLCSRTRQVAKDDSELVWVGSGVPPPLPVALQRQVISCDRCTVDDVSITLVGSRRGLDWPAGAELEQALRSADSGEPFAVSRFEDRVGEALGFSAKGRPFRLIEARRTVDEACHVRVLIQWCARLEPSGRSLHGFAVRCVDPTPQTVFCDEEKTRVAGWQPLEELASVVCQWGDPSKPRCRLSGPPKPLQPGAPSMPLLQCRPWPWSPGSEDYRCSVVVGP